MVETCDFLDTKKACRNPQGCSCKVIASQASRIADLEAQLAERVKAAPRKSFPILSSGGAKIDHQLVADHGEQAKKNHYQTVDRLAERGGLSWGELFAVLHNRAWKKVDENEAMIACRALEARFLSALEATLPAPKVAECATEGCEQPAGIHFTRGNVGSHYCIECYKRVQRISVAALSGDAS